MKRRVLKTEVSSDCQIYSYETVKIDTLELYQFFFKQHRTEHLKIYF